MTKAVSEIPAGLFCSAQEQCPRGWMAQGAGAGSGGTDCSGGSPLRVLQTQPTAHGVISLQVRVVLWVQEQTLVLGGKGSKE